MKTLLIRLTISAFLCAIVYLLLSFCCWNFNPAEWIWIARIFCAICFAVCFIACMSFDEEKKWYGTFRNWINTFLHLLETVLLRSRKKENAEKLINPRFRNRFCNNPFRYKLNFYEWNFKIYFGMVSVGFLDRDYNCSITEN